MSASTSPGETGPGAGTDALRRVLGIRHPVVQGPFGGGLSTVALAAAVSEHGGLGSYGAHVLAPERIGPLVDKLRTATSAPFAVNLWVPQEGEESEVPDARALAGHTDRLATYYAEFGLTPPDAGELDGRPDFRAQVEAVIEAAPPVVSVVMGPPPLRLADWSRRSGAVLVGTATTVAEARVLEESGCDVVVASGTDAGGHRGSFLAPVRESSVGTFSLVPQIVDAVRIPVVAAGGVADGRGFAAALTLGAHGVQVGTGFLKTAESGAAPAHRTVLFEEAARTTVLTRLFSGRPARGVVNGLVRELADAEERVPPYPVQNALMAPIRAEAARSERGDRSNLWSGQAVLLAAGGSAADYLKELVTGAERVLGRPL